MTYYSYDHENRLTNLEYIGNSDEDDISSASFEYNGNGIRRKAVEGDVITRYYYDGLNVLFEKTLPDLPKRPTPAAWASPGGIGGLISMKRFEQEDDGLEEKDPLLSLRRARLGQRSQQSKGRIKRRIRLRCLRQRQEQQEVEHLPLQLQRIRRSCRAVLFRCKILRSRNRKMVNPGSPGLHRRAE